MRRRRIFIPLIVAAVLIGGAALAVLVRKTRPPESARLLPTADAYIYINLRPLRRAGVFQNMPKVQLETEYQEFVDATGFQFERDLEEVAFAVHASTNAATPNRYSEIFIGRFESPRLLAYLRKLSQGVERYHDYDLYSIPLQGRTVRVTLLGPAIVAVSNAEDAAVIYGVIDRYRKLASPFGGPRLLRQHYRHIPLTSFAWAIAKMPGQEQVPQWLALPGGFSFPALEGSVIVTSLRYLGGLEFRTEAFAKSPEAATQIASQLNTFVALFRTLETQLQVSGSDKDVKEFFESLKVEQKDSRTLLSATVPPGFVRKVFTEPANVSPAITPPEEQAPANVPPKKKSSGKRR